jgi:hypothetical protein
MVASSNVTKDKNKKSTMAHLISHQTPKSKKLDDNEEMIQ